MSISPSPSTDLAGLWVPLVTPFDADDAVDHDALAGLTRRLAAAGVTGTVVCGSTGEAAALDEHEQLAALATVAQAAPALPRIMGLSGYHLGQTLAWVQRLNRETLAALLVPAPHYIRPSQQGLIDWFTTIADASAAPLVLYDIPYRTGATLARETLLTLAAHPNIVAIKDCGGDPAKTRALIADGRLQVLAGEDAQLFGTVAEGGAGAIAASAHLRTEDFVRMVRWLREGKLDEARTLWQPLVPLIELLFAEPNPGPLKAALALEGLMGDTLRSPMTAATEPTRQRLAALRAALT
ncbi:4-hydroxy-tetrahydrodipicolinate synthase [Variovorax sp. J22G21]|uniref:4-hydroxy-tetrahydrodipicolinate synthase n=1 Tax=Variovorax fucosicus TaxID=3053517 RepID=UPI00257623A0|nr:MULTISPECIES: 4-hydroxy-tetrahydrodipicolinate synthase [unclassified Variovorax]MDM0040632.1 4-hydroxy-tetrahydrodipicolinate synthase [Variovorax sp. J22R193]MDM0062005.1 4-hydroxy-tetrahydrodipicolinate synthase [Variovorax sp. J22G21]